VITNRDTDRSRAHDDAVRRGEDHYTDPETGARVFTELFHRRRGVCCGSLCRHCPFDHVNVGPFPDPE
jgi:hypothetical protein